MTPAIQLLGVPRVLRYGTTPVPLRGHKVWGLLTYLVLHPAGAGRHHLASLLFEDAADPLAALRWNLSELRRALGDESLRGKVIVLSDELIACADISAMAFGSWSDALTTTGLGHNLLEGVHFSSSPSFDVWLSSERRRFQAIAEAVLHKASLTRLASGAPGEAAITASRLVCINPLNESFQALLVRCLAAAGDKVAAARQAAACRELLARELGIAPGLAVTKALHTVPAATIGRAALGRVGATAQRETGETVNVQKCGGPACTACGAPSARRMSETTER